METKDPYVDVDSDLSGQDAAEMAKLGKRQQLSRRFDFMSILGFSCLAMTTWVGILVVFVYELQNGGPAGLVIGFLVVWSGYGTVVASLCEMMSMWPTAGGQYHWTFTMAPERFAVPLSYFVGWQSVIAWQATGPSASYLGATLIQGLVVLNYPDYIYERWHGTLIIYAVVLVTVLVNTFAIKWLPKVESTVLVIYICSFIATVVVMTVMSPQKASAHDVFQTFYNTGMWPTQGVSVFVGLQGVIFAWLGADGAIHMAEARLPRSELKNASTVLPWSLMSSIAINGVLGFAMILVVLFCGGDLLTALASPTGYPVEAIFTYGSGSIAGGTGLSSLLIFIGLMAAVTVFTAASRELWAFARDRGVPAADVLMRIHKPSKLPLWTMFVTTMVIVLLALINIGSAEAFNAVISLTVSAFLGSYMIPLALVLYRRVQAHRGRGKQLPWGPWRLGTWGIVINAYALVWCIVMWFWAFWPSVIDPSPAEMNWNILAWGASTLFAVAFWLVDGRRRYKGPIRDAAGGQIEKVMGWGNVNVPLNDADHTIMSETSPE